MNIDNIQPVVRSAPIAGGDSSRSTAGQSIARGNSVFVAPSHSIEGVGVPSSSPMVALEVPASNQGSYSPDELSGKLSTLDNDVVPIADTFKVLQLIHKIFVEMARQAAESRQDAYLAQWASLESKADKMNDAAKSDLAAGLVSGVFGIVGGGVGLGFGGAAIMKGGKIGKADAQDGNLPIRNSRDSRSDFNSRDTKGVLSEAEPIPAKVDVTDKSDATLVKAELADNDGVSVPGNSNNGSARLDDGGSVAEPPVDPNTKLQTQATGYSSIAMAAPQLTQGAGTLGSGIAKVEGDYAREDGTRADAEATKAQADVDTERQFVQNANEGMRSVQDLTKTNIEARQQVVNKIFS